MHVTLRGLHGLPSFRRQGFYKALEKVVRCMMRRNDFRIVEYSVQDTHIHMIVEAASKEALANGMKSFTGASNWALNKAWGRKRGKVWADRYHRQDLGSPKQVRNALVYCLNNYKKHAGLPEGDTHVDECSSGPWFVGWSEGRARKTPDRPRPTALPQTALLQSLWQKYGRIHPGETPRAAG